MAKKTTTEPASQKRQLRRPVNGKVLAGVAAAFANYFGIDVVLARIVWVFLLLPGGAPGLILYILCWLVIPEEN